MSNYPSTSGAPSNSGFVTFSDSHGPSAPDVAEIDVTLFLNLGSDLSLPQHLEDDDPTPWECLDLISVNREATDGLNAIFVESKITRTELLNLYVLNPWVREEFAEYQKTMETDPVGAEKSRAALDRVFKSFRESAPVKARTRARTCAYQLEYKSARH